MRRAGSSMDLGCNQRPVPLLALVTCSRRASLPGHRAASMAAMQSVQQTAACRPVAAAAAAAARRARSRRARVQSLPDRSARQEEGVSEQQLPSVWCSGLLRGTFGAQVAAAFPAVTWQPPALARMLYFGLPAAAAGALVNSQLAAALCAGAGSSSGGLAPGVACGSLQAALLHAGQEGVFAVLLPAACWCALGDRVVAARASRYWVAQTLATCALLFPVVDPLLVQLWQPAVQAVLGDAPAPAAALVLQLQQAAAAGDWQSVGLHVLASGLLGPAWEEVFWRGFFLTALTKVLPLPACVAISAGAFAGLHLSPLNAAPLALLGAACDLLYLRSGGNLLPPLLLHGLWNTSQVLQIALLHKDSFV